MANKACFAVPKSTFILFFSWCYLTNVGHWRENNSHELHSAEGREKTNVRLHSTERRISLKLTTCRKLTSCLSKVGPQCRFGSVHKIIMAISASFFFWRQLLRHIWEVADPNCTTISLSPILKLWSDPHPQILFLFSYTIGPVATADYREWHSPNCNKPHSTKRQIAHLILHCMSVLLLANCSSSFILKVRQSSIPRGWCHGG